MERNLYLQQIHSAYMLHPVVTLLGPRQSGKTTLAKQYIEKYSTEHKQIHYFDLEDPTDLDRLSIDPKLALSNCEGLIIIDEIQKVPEIFPLLRVLVDNSNRNQKFLILGSASRDLIRQSSESLAGRVEYIEVHPFALYEINDLEKCWIQGGYPVSYLAHDEQQSYRWRENYIRTFLEQDIPALGVQITPLNIRRFWLMLAHYHGAILNASELGNAMDITHKTVKRYLDLLTGTYMIRQLAPWFENIGKRQVKAPKIYFRDTGLLHTLLGINSKTTLNSHPKLGASWEGFALEQIIRFYGARDEECFFWATHSKAEIDLLILHQGKLLGFECKYSSSPKVTSSMKTCIDTLKLQNLTIIYPGNKSYLLTNNIKVCPLLEYVHVTRKQIYNE